MNESFNSERDLDELDQSILRILQEDGRISNAELARQINLSQPAVYNRIKRLEKRGYIQRYAAILNPEMLGYDLLCFVNISLMVHSNEQFLAFRETISQIPEVLECYHITGAHDFLLKVVLRNRKDLQTFIVDKLTTIPGVENIQTGVVMGEVKSTTAYDVGNNKD